MQGQEIQSRHEKEAVNLVVPKIKPKLGMVRPAQDLDHSKRCIGLESFQQRSTIFCGMSLQSQDWTLVPKSHQFVAKSLALRQCFESIVVSQNTQLHAHFLVHHWKKTISSSEVEKMMQEYHERLICSMSLQEWPEGIWGVGTGNACCDSNRKYPWTRTSQ